MTRETDTEYGFALSSEEHAPNALVELARRAEANGFTFALISDHYHPWVDRQGHSPFVWSVIGAIATATERLALGTGVTCPTVRIHPAVIAQAAATCASMMDGRFFLGVGTGENLNEHILGDRWPETDVRLEMLEEAVHVIRLLWQGGEQSHHGKHYTVENARLYTLPSATPKIHVAAGGPKAARVAARIGDGLVATSPDDEVISTFTDAGGTGPRYGQMTVCWGEDRDVAVKTLHEIWPNAGIKGELAQELPSPHHFEQAAQLVKPEDLAESVPVGPDPGRYVEMLQQYAESFTHVYVHQVGPDQEGFFRFWERELVPRLP